MSLYMHAIPKWRIRVKGCCVDRLNPPPESGRESRHGAEIDFALSLDESVHVTLISFHNEPLRLAYVHIGLVRGETRTIIGGGLFVTFAGLGLFDRLISLRI